ncbi:WSC domain-containing protein 2-like isoform X3 [Clupea harengus]|uniref:WSC domain-containing protein 2-like isoform X3 n=1 Tax=Clupea harengus TaxID=7950 RepID=A0A6P8FZU7_CLUHA|nr:WSC domain-containing protein 2-like isoform X3 [Clupea harengus]
MFSSFKGHPFVFLLWFLVFVTLLTVGFFIKLLSNWGWKYVLFYDDKNTNFKGCFKTPDNATKAFPLIAFMPAMTVGKCVDFCTEKKLSLAVLAGQRCLCGFSTKHFPLHVRENITRCLYHCPGQPHENCGTDIYNVVYQTEVQDNRCMNRSFLLDQPKQLIALASFPGSGNTWARHLIELGTGFYTGSYYFDRSLFDKGFKGEKDDWRSGRNICIKTHESSKKEIEAFDSSILLIRNPYRTLMAEFNRKYGGHVGFAPMLLWKGKTWPKFVEVYSEMWASHTLAWLSYSGPLHVVHYEELRRDIFIHLRGLVLFLGLRLSVDRLLCAENQREGRFRRSGLHRLGYDPFTEDMRTSIDYHIKKVDIALRAKTFSGVPDEYHLRQI